MALSHKQVDMLFKIKKSEDVIEAFEILKHKSNMMQKTLCRVFAVGDAVSFESNLGHMTGKIIKINNRTVRVQCYMLTDIGDDLVMTILPSLLTRIKHSERRYSL